VTLDARDFLARAMALVHGCVLHALRVHAQKCAASLAPRFLPGRASLIFLNCRTRFSGDCRKSHPNQYSTSDKASLNSGFSALTFLHPCRLFWFSVKLLNFPTQGTRILYVSRKILSQVLGHGPIRALA